MANVEIVCNGKVRRQTHTFSGSFSMELANTALSSRPPTTVMNAGVADQEVYGTLGGPAGPFAFAWWGGSTDSYMNSPSNEGGGLNQLSLIGCELRATQPGFQSDTIQLSLHRPLDDPDVGVITLHRAGSITGTDTSLVSREAPKKAQKAYQSAVKEIRKETGNRAKIVAELEKAVQIYPEHAAAWELLGQIREEQQDSAGARQAFEAAVAADSKYIRPNVALMELSVREKNWEEVSKWSSRVTELNPYLLSAHYNQGVANLNLNRMELAQESFQGVRDAYKGDDFPFASYALGYLHSNKGEFDSAALHLRHFLEITDEPPEAANVRAHLAEWEGEGRIEAVEKH